MKNSEKRLIACDIDDVLADTAPRLINFSNQNFATNLTAEDFLENWSEMWGVDLEEAERRAEVIHDSDIFSEMQVVKGSLEVLTRARAAGFDIVAATSRPLRLRSVSEAWLDANYQGIFSEAYFSGIYDGERHPDMHFITKRDLYGKIKPTVAIDDQPKHCLGAREINVESSMLFGDHKWNREFDCAASGIIRCRNWREIGEELGLNSVAA